MAIIRRDRDRFPRPFPDAFDEFFRFPDLWEEGRTTMPVRGLAADIYDTGEAIVAEMAVPGLKPDDINISVSGDNVTITGERKEEQKDEKKDYYQRQLRYGSFAQTFTLPAPIQSDKVEATFHHGILKITMPKSEEAKPKTIKVKVQGE